ncbi:MAG: LytR C-terminal domain-containing protein [Gemmatimonadaceae bacterium]|nr:LytR C-terminal domain-containing protein [Gemmatimonadaceae bacterium]
MTDPGQFEEIEAPRPRRKIGRWLLLVLVAVGGWLAWQEYRGSSEVQAAGAPGSFDDEAYNVVAPDGVRIKVEVQNATATRGLARQATLYLRDRGFDVVSFGNASERRDSTLVLDRSGHADWAALVATAMKARAESRPDTSRYLDVTVLVGGDWRPPALPFYP